jgi:PEP-CTERM motif-containing protein
MRLGLVPRRWLLSLFEVLLPVLWSSVAAAVPLFTETLTSGSINMGAAGFPFGSINVTTSDNATIGSIFAAPFGFAGPTGASVTWNQIDFLQTGVTHAGESFMDCSAHNAFPNAPCAFLESISLSMSVPQTPPPPLPGGPLSSTVPGTFSLSLLNVGLFDSHFQSIGGLPTSGMFYAPAEGPASLTFRWLPDFDQWFFTDGEAQFVTPEPTTLLLFATSAAGLGVAAWRRRRHA